MPIGHPLPSNAKHVTLNCPAVAMTKSEAEKLSAALTRARTHMADRIASVTRSRMFTEAGRARIVAELRADLDALDAFQEAHDEAHGLGGD